MKNVTANQLVILRAVAEYKTGPAIKTATGFVSAAAHLAALAASGLVKAADGGYAVTPAGKAVIDATAGFNAEGKSIPRKDVYDRDAGESLIGKKPAAASAAAKEKAAAEPVAAVEAATGATKAAEPAAKKTSGKKPVAAKAAKKKPAAKK